MTFGELMYYLFACLLGWTAHGIIEALRKEKPWDWGMIVVCSGLLILIVLERLLYQ